MTIVCVIGSALLIAALGGVAAGQNQRSLVATQTTTAELDVQFELGLNDLSAGQGLSRSAFYVAGEPSIV